jgi:hypothetical protein
MQLSPFDRGSARFAGSTGGLLSWTAFRWLATILTPAIASLLLLRWLAEERHSGFETFAWFDSTLQVPLVLLVGATVLVTSYLAVTFAFVQMRFASEVIEVGIPSLNAALAVGTGVPDWVGDHEDDRVVRLWSPAGISTTTFKVAPRVRQIAIRTAEQVASQQLDRMFPEQQRASPSDVPLTSVAPLEPVTEGPTRLQKTAIWAVSVAGLSAISLTTDSPVMVIGVAVIPLAIAGLFGWVLATPRMVLHPVMASNPDSDDLTDARRVESYRASRIGLACRTGVFTLVIGVGLLAITNEGRLSPVQFVVIYLLFVGIGASTLKALIYRRRINQGLLGEPPPRRSLPAIILGTGLLAGGFGWMTQVTDDSTVGAARRGDVSDLTLPTLATILILIGTGTMISALARYRANRQFAAYQSELAPPPIDGPKARDRQLCCRTASKT